LAEHNRPNMKKNNLIRFVQSLVILPVVAVPIVIPGLPNAEISGINQNVLVQKFNNEVYGDLVVKDAVDQKLAVQEAKAKKAESIDAYFQAHNMPLEGTGMKMVVEAEKNKLDWRLMPAIAVRESTGGKNACEYVLNNPFGWGSCKIGFKSTEEAIETVALNLGGNNPKTEFHYAGKTTEEILNRYNPPTIAPNYAKQVMSIMNEIGVEDKIPPITATI